MEVPEASRGETLALGEAVEDAEAAGRAGETLPLLASALPLALRVARKLATAIDGSELALAEAGVGLGYADPDPEEVAEAKEGAEEGA